jgi:hypothetical protein
MGSIGRIGFSIAVATSVGLTASAQVSIAAIPLVGDERVPFVAPSVLVEDDVVPRRLRPAWGWQARYFIGQSDHTHLAAGMEFADEDALIPLPTDEPRLYIIGPGNWEAGTDSVPRPTLEEEYWDSQVAPQPWLIGRHSPSPWNDDPTVSAKYPSTDSDTWPEIGPYYAPWIAQVLGEREWMEPQPPAAIDYETWLDPKPIETPFLVIAKPRGIPGVESGPDALFNDFPVGAPPFLATIVEDEFWVNPFSPFPYWGRWPRPDPDQQPPGVLIVPPLLPCVVEPALLGEQTISVVFTPQSLQQVLFTDICGDVVNATTFDSIEVTFDSTDFTWDGIS